MRSVFYRPGAKWIVDTRGPQGLGVYGGKPCPDDCVVISEDEAFDRIEALCITDPKEIDVDRFDYLLNVLPPERWAREGYSESFQMMERTNGRVTCIACRIDTRYFEFEDICGMSHADICRKVMASKAWSEGLK